MKKSDREINLLDISQTEYRDAISSKVKTTDINILLNRVRMTKKTELKKRIIFLMLLLFGVFLVGVFTLI
ncbi:hypothetical protein N9T17_00075 [Candidatus Pelagibacter sp.]|nr:hypothetical protein [Candidatus Pelagibacter sp.]